MIIKFNDFYFKDYVIFINFCILETNLICKLAYIRILKLYKLKVQKSFFTLTENLKILRKKFFCNIFGKVVPNKDIKIQNYYICTLY